MEVTLKATDKQIAFLKDRTRNLLMDGGFGSAKTRALCLKALYRARVPGSRECLYRKYFSTFRKTTLKTLLDGDGEAPPVIPPGTYTHNKSEKTIKIKGGGEIFYTGLEDPEQVRSLNLTGIGGDEVNELSEREYLFADKRPRMAHPDGNQHYCVTNPHTPSHFLCRDFGIAGGHVIRPGHSRIHTMPEDNPFLPADYIANLKTMTGLSYKRYYLGLWVGSDGLVYDGWNREVHVQDASFPPKRVIVGVDDGFAHPFAAVRLEVDGDGRAHVARLVHRSKMLPDDKVAAVKDLAQGAEAVLVDPSAPTLIELLGRAGLPAQSAFHDVKPGIGWVSARLVAQADGRVRLTVAPDCDAMVREFESYEWLPSKATGGVKDQPKKEMDDALDALRYAVAHLDSGQTAGIMVDTPEAWRAYQQANPDLMMSDDGWTSVDSGGGRFIGM